MSGSSHINGDLSVGRNAAIGGKAVVQGNVTIGHNLNVKGWLEAPNIKDINKGVYTTSAALNTAYPNPRNGWVAGVLDETGDTPPEKFIQLYMAVGGEWVEQEGYTMVFQYDLDQPLEEIYQQLVDNAIGGLRCETAADVANKVIVTKLGAAGLIDWATFKMSFKYANSAASSVTLTIRDEDNSSYATYPLYFNGAAVSDENTWESDVEYNVLFDPDAGSEGVFYVVQIVRQYDERPTKDSSNPVTSDGVYHAINDPNVIDTTQLKNGAVTTAKIADSNVSTAKIADSSVTTAKIADSAVTTAKITDGNVTTAKINDSAVTTAKINDGAVTTQKIADGNVTTTKLDNEAVTNPKLSDDAVTTAKIGDEQVTWEKLDENTKQLIYAPGGVRIPLAQVFGNDEHIGISQKTLTESRDSLQSQIDAIVAGDTTVNITVSPSAIFVGESTNVTVKATASRNATTIKVAKNGVDMSQTASNTDHLTITDTLAPTVKGTTSYKGKFVVAGLNKETSAKSVSAVYPIYYAVGATRPATSSSDWHSLPARTTAVGAALNSITTAAGDYIFIEVPNGMTMGDIYLSDIIDTKLEKETATTDREDAEGGAYTCYKNVEPRGAGTYNYKIQ